MDRESSETFRELVGMAEAKFGRIATELIATQVMRATAGGNWPVQLAAMEALLRRFRFADRDGLKVASRPNGTPLGCYSTRRSGARDRPYATQLHGLDPLWASCDCADFRHAGLGACKHVLVVLDDLHSRPRKLAQAMRASQAGPQLWWDPVRPLRGPGDWMDRVFLAPERGKKSRAHMNIARRFGAHGGQVAALKRTYTDDGPRRRELATDLLRFIKVGGLARKLQRGLADAALIALLEEELQRLDAGVVLATGELTRALKSLRLPLYAYQRAGVQQFLRQGRLLLADDMGLGKTAQAIASCHVLHALGRVQRGLLVVPAPLKHQWLREWERFSDVPVEVVDGSPGERQATYQRKRSGYLVINYEQLLRDLPQVQRFGPDVVVLDEAQRIKNWATKTALYVKQLSPRYRLVLTGTPMENRLEELASVMQWVDRGALEPSWRLNPWHSSPAGARNLDTLRERLRPRMLRRVRKEVLDQLPARTDTRVPVELTPEQAETHSDLDRPIAQLVRISKRRPLTHKEFLRLMGLLNTQRMICNGLALSQYEETWTRIDAGPQPTAAVLRGLFSPKLGELRALVETLVVEQQRRVVVFSQWRRMLRLAHWAVQDLLAEAGLRAVFFTGEESQKRRTQNVIELHDDEATRVMFATDAGGVGLNLQRAASCCINLELPWNPAVLEQRIGRVYRLGQSQPVEVYNLVSEAGIEARIATLVGNKQALFQGLFDGTSDEVTFDTVGSFMERIEHVVEAAALPEPDSEARDTDEELEGEELEASGATESAPNGAATGATASETSHAGATFAIDPTQVSALAGQLTVQMGPDGGVRIDAPPKAAAMLAGVLEQLAGQLRRGPAGPATR
ncbi:MAG: DEAD/DEAH box helicase [Myxococcales bacterium]|nr:DEAD/DEAH box helicase [Myxococcales bacterium]